MKAPRYPGDIEGRVAPQSSDDLIARTIGAIRPLNDSEVHEILSAAEYPPAEVFLYSSQQDCSRELAIVQSFWWAQDWYNLDKFATRALVQIQQLLSPQREIFLNWHGAAARQLERYPVAAMRYQQALAACKAEKVRVWILSNLAGVSIRLRLLDEARRYLDEALELRADSAEGICNRLCIASLRRDVKSCELFAEQLAEAHASEARHADSPLGKTLRTDPDLMFLRRTAAFHSVFPELCMRIDQNLN